MLAAVGGPAARARQRRGQLGRTGEIVEVRGAGGEPPYVVRFDDGHTALVFPGRTRSSSIRVRRARRSRRALPPEPRCLTRQAPGIQLER